MQQPEKQRDDSHSIAPASEPATILVVDDDAPICRLLDLYLTAFGYRVLLAGDGEKAVEIAHKHPEIRLAILDVVMSGLSGQRLAAELTIALPEVAILFSSGHPTATVSRLGIDLRSAHFLQKPCPAPELRRKIQEMLSTR